MHEWALAEAVLAAASEAAEKKGLKRVSEVRLKVGELQGIDTEILEFALQQLKKEKFKNTKFSIEMAKAKLKCRACSHAWIFNRENVDEDTAEMIHFVPEVAHAYVKCPKCGSPDFEVTEGRGVWLDSIKGER